jgi:hypothetical protein
MHEFIIKFIKDARDNFVSTDLWFAAEPLKH